jgi:hypothetical protein
MAFIVVCTGERVIEDRGGLIETDPMFLEIRPCLVEIPLE